MRKKRNKIHGQKTSSRIARNKTDMSFLYALWTTSGGASMGAA